MGPMRPVSYQVASPQNTTFTVKYLLWVGAAFWLPPSRRRICQSFRFFHVMTSTNLTQAVRRRSHENARDVVL